MNHPAYDECYLDSMFQKNRYLFVLIARNCSGVFQTIRQYMHGTYRQYMDQGNPLYLNKTPKQILGDLGIKLKNEFQVNDNYDEFILEWMADIYTYMQWKYNIPSSHICEKIDPEDLYNMYYPLHETSIENGVSKLINIKFV